jgi:predicted component of type VI protein secretion system
MKTYIVGRSRKSDIIIDHINRTVSRKHLKITVEDDGKYYILDCESTNGTYRQEGTRWAQIKQSYVDIDEPLLLGRYKTTIRELLELRAENPLEEEQ